MKSQTILKTPHRNAATKPPKKLRLFEVKLLTFTTLKKVPTVFSQAQGSQNKGKVGTKIKPLDTSQQKSSTEKQ